MVASLCGHMTCTDCSEQKHAPPSLPSCHLKKRKKDEETLGSKDVSFWCDTGSSSEPQFTNWMDFPFQSVLKGLKGPGLFSVKIYEGEIWQIQCRYFSVFEMRDANSEVDKLISLRRHSCEKCELIDHSCTTVAERDFKMRLLVF